MGSTGAFELAAVAGACAIYCLSLGLEYRRHLENLKMLRFIGFKIDSMLGYRLYYGLLGMGPVALVIAAISSGNLISEHAVLVSLPVLFLAQLLRGRAISALGNGWIMGFVWGDQWRPVDTGPYRWLRHPEYVARFMDFIGFAVMVGFDFHITITLVALVGLVTVVVCHQETHLMKADAIAKGLSNPAR